MKSSRYNFFNCFMICIALGAELAFIYGQRGEAWSLVLPGTVMRLIRYAILQPSLCCVFAFAVSTHRKLLDILLTDAEHVLVFFPVLKPDFTYKFSITAYTSRIPFKNLATQSKCETNFCWALNWKIFVGNWIEDTFDFEISAGDASVATLQEERVFFIAQLCNSIMGHEHKNGLLQTTV